MWGANDSDFDWTSASEFQSTHPCGVRSACNVTFIYYFVSIHAPVWGAKLVNTHNKTILGFNPRTRVGCEMFSTITSIKNKVSIHAPVWGANAHILMTWFYCLFQSTHPCGVRSTVLIPMACTGAFQFTHPCGVRTVSTFMKPAIALFQSTHPCGVRIRLRSSRSRGKCFNPRTRVGCERRFTWLLI